MSIQKVSIRPDVSMLSVLQHLPYKEWFALAEFVDNALQSAINFEDKLIKAEGKDYLLEVSIDISIEGDGRITIRDNAAGIAETDFPRAFRTAQIPPDATGLSEFGMGMKSAATWFASNWKVRTSAIGEKVEREVNFDVKKIVDDKLENLDVSSKPSKEEHHFTEIILTGLHHKPKTKTLSKIREHLTDIYRCFIRDKMLILKINGEVLEYIEPAILVAPFYKDLEGEAIEWRKSFDINIGSGCRAHGFAAISKKASSSGAGFALFRRNRLIQGSGDEGYRPHDIFGMPGTFAYKRIFGEIHLEGFQVSHTKDGIQWGQSEERFLELLKDELQNNGMPMIQQAREHRVGRKSEDFMPAAKEALDRTSESIQRHLPTALETISNSDITDAGLGKELKSTNLSTRKVIDDLMINGKPWKVVLELTTDPSIGDWYEISTQKLDGEEAEPGVRFIGMRLSLVHPFMERFGGVDLEQIEPLLRIVAALGISEVRALEGGSKSPSAVRVLLNELLRDALSRP